MFGPAVNCVNCKFCSSEIFYNAKKERVCSNCLQKEYDAVCASLDAMSQDLRATIERQNTTISEMVKENESLNLKITTYEAILEQIKNFAQLIKR